jgi:Flp pilus assembly protein TadG
VTPTAVTVGSRTSRARARGVETVELAIVLPVFLLLLFAMLDFSRLFFTEITLQHAMREGGRFGVTGQRLPDPDDPGTLQSRVDSIRQVVEESAVGISVAADSVSISSVHGGQGSAGGPGDTFTISLSHRFLFATPLVGQFFDGGAYQFTVSTTFRNEPFEPGSS